MPAAVRAIRQRAQAKFSKIFKSANLATMSFNKFAEFFGGSFSAVPKPLLGEDIRFAAFFKLYKMYALLHSSKLIILGNLCETISDSGGISANICIHVPNLQNFKTWFRDSR